MKSLGDFGQVGGITYSAADYSYPGQSGLGQFNLTPENKKMLTYTTVVGAGIFIVLMIMKSMPDSVEVKSNPKKNKLSRRQQKKIKKLWSEWEDEDEEHIPPIPK
jgi:hypothetical protein